MVDRAQWQTYGIHFLADVHARARARTCRGMGRSATSFISKVPIADAWSEHSVNPEIDVLICLASVLGLGNAAASAHPGV